MRPVPYPRRQATGDRRLGAKGVAVVLGAMSVGACTWWWVRAVAGGAASAATMGPASGSADTHLVRRFLELRSDNPGLVVLASHGRRRVSPGAIGLEGLIARVSHIASPATLHGVAVVADANALEFLGRRASLVRGRNPDYSSSRLVIPLGALD